MPAGVVACIPKKVHRESGDEEEKGGSGEVRKEEEETFRLTVEELESVISKALSEKVDPEEDVQAPQWLISPEGLKTLREQREDPSPPSWVPLESGEMREFDPETGIVLRKMSNGIRVNIKVPLRV